MYRLYIVASVLFSSVVLAPAVQASDLTHALARMDAIIVQMQELRTEFQVLAQSISQVPSPAVLGAVHANILGDDVRFGSTNNDIKRIQKLLATDSTIYPYGVVSGYFGPKTQEAIRLFQSRFGLDAVGVVGPTTRALLEVFFATYPDEQYPDDVLQKGRPEDSTASGNTVVQGQDSAIVQGGTASISTLKSVDVSEDNDEYIIRSYKEDGTRNRDLILYPKNEEDLIRQIAEKLHAPASEVRARIEETDFDFAQAVSPTEDSVNKESASASVEEARTAVFAVRRLIRNAALEGKNTSIADDLYSEARTLFTDARNALEQDNYVEATELGRAALDLARQAEDVL